LASARRRALEIDADCASGIVFDHRVRVNVDGLQLAWHPALGGSPCSLVKVHGWRPTRGRARSVGLKTIGHRLRHRVPAMGWAFALPPISAADRRPPPWQERRRRSAIRGHLPAREWDDRHPCAGTETSGARSPRLRRRLRRSATASQNRTYPQQRQRSNPPARGKERDSSYPPNRLRSGRGAQVVDDSRRNATSFSPTRSYVMQPRDVLRIAPPAVLVGLLTMASSVAKLCPIQLGAVHLPAGRKAWPRPSFPQ
jgi:hypothetical protein